MANKNTLKDAGWLLSVWIVIVLVVGMWVLTASEVEEIQAKKPEDEIVSFQVEKDKRSGEVFDVQIIRCKKCGDIISYIRFDRSGHVVWATVNSAHVCGIKAREYAHQYKGLGFAEWRWPTFGAMLDYYQKKFRLKR